MMLDSPFLFNLAMFAPSVAIPVALLCYIYHRRRIEPERLVPAVAYAVAVVMWGGIAGSVGFGVGTRPCSFSAAGNLCDLGAFLTGMVTGSVAMLSVALALILLVRPVPRP